METLLDKTAPRNAERRADEWLWALSRVYARAYSWVKDRTGRNLKGLGFLLRRLRVDREFEARGHRWFFDHRIGGTYMRLVGGQYNEPEVQNFLQFVARDLGGTFTFVDVGANIGEMVIAMADHPSTSRVIAFEPHPICAEVCRKNLLLNQLSGRAEVRPLLVSDGTAQPYVIDEKYTPTSGIRRDVAGAPLTVTVRLDDQLELRGDCVVLIDVEGAELDVLKGAQRFIAASRPLIIFEYNYVTRNHYSLADVRRVLGDHYELFRLRADGFLDLSLANTANCVAVHSDSVFRALCGQRLTA